MFKKLRSFIITTVVLTSLAFSAASCSPSQDISANNQRLKDLAELNAKNNVKNVSGCKILRFVKGADGYYVYRKTANTGWTRIATVKGGTKNSYSDTTAKAGTKYTYTVRAYHGSFRSYFVTKGISCTYLPAPALISATRTSGGVTVKYSKVSQATSYYIYRKTLGGSWQRIAVVKGAANTTFVDTTAKKGTTYNYTVRAYSSPSRSAYTSYLSVK